jgi:hypothetical protein
MLLPMSLIVRSLSSLVTEMLLLRQAVQTIRNYGPARHAAIRRWCGMATTRLALADDTTDVHFAGAANVLYRQAIECMVAALSLAKAPAHDDLPIQAIATAEKLRGWVQSGAVPKPPKQYAHALSSIQLGERLSPDEAIDDTTVAQRHSLEGLAHWLRPLVESRSLRQIWFARIIRCACTAALLAVVMIWGYGALFSPKNLALHQRVTMSSRQPGSPDPAGATDGRIVGPFQAHTQREAEPYITIDLGQVRHVGRVVIYNRTDGLYADALPLTLEFSSDGSRFRQVARRTTMFTGSLPWVFKAPPSEARYIRVRGHESGYVVLTELRVYER